VTGSLMHTPSLHTLPPPTPRALIADDQPDVLIALRLLLRNAGYQTEAVTSPAEVLEAITRGQFDLVLPPARPRPSDQVVTPMKRLPKSRNVSKLSAILSNRARGDYSPCSITFVRT